jgi:hypothetical protein
MKKIIIAIMLAVVLVAGGFGGLAYAQSIEHEPMTGQKLVGWGPFGLAPTPSFLFLATFSLTNPDGVSQITIDRISIFAADGTVIYEGPPLLGMEGSPLTTPLEPHQSVDIWLAGYVLGWPTGPVDPLDFPVSDYYTVEIFWSGEKKGLPLTGWSWMLTLDFDAEGNLANTPSTTAMSLMVNMEQELEPED